MVYEFYTLNYLLLIVLGLIYYKKYNFNLQLKLFLFFLVYSFFTEAIGYYVAHIVKGNTAVIYNSWNVVSFLFYSYFFLSKIKNKTNKTILKIITVSFIALFILNGIFFRNYLEKVFIENVVFGKIALAVIVIIYFTELLKSDAILNIKKSMYFWISIGILMYSIGFIPVYVVAEYISYSIIFRYITLGLNIIMSCCFITGFVLSKKEYNN